MRSVVAGLTLSVMASFLPRAAEAGERIVFCPPASGACEAGWRTLGKSEGGSWVAVDDDALLKHGAKAKHLPPLLYFSSAAYDEAMAGLSGKDKEQAIVHRARQIAGSPRVELLELLHADCVDLAIAASGDGDDVLVALDAATMLAGGPDQYRDASLQTALQGAQQSLATLRAELPSPAPASTGYRLEAEALAELEGGPRGRNGEWLFPAAAPQQVYFIPGQHVDKRVDPELPELQAYGWHGGAVAVMRPDEAAAVAIKGPRPRLLYHSNSAFLADRWSLTEAQLDRRLRARLHAVPSRERAGLAAQLAFQHAVLVLQYTAAVQRQAPAALARWNGAVRDDLVNLRAVLSAAHDSRVDAKALRARLRADVALTEVILRTGAESDPNLPTIERVSAVVARLPPEN